MSNQFLKLRRSAVPGKIPEVSSLDFGEIALNTYDGLAFMKKSGSSGEQIVAIGSTTGSFTGSFKGSFTGSFSGSLANLQGTVSHIPYFSASQVLADSTMFQVDNGGGAFSIALNQNGVSGLAPEALFVYQPSTTSYNVISGKGNLNNYLQLNIQNENNGASASSDVVATANNGTETSFYVDMGINNQNYINNGNGVGNSNDAYLYSVANNFHIGNAANNGSHLGFFVGGFDTDINKKFELNPNNQHEMTGSLDISGSLIAKNITSSLFGTASWAQNSLTASYVASVASASFASTASSADNFLVRGTLTAQTIVAQVITASTEFITGSTKFGSIVTNTHQFTGSVSISGSLNVTGSGITGSLFGTSSWANNATTASYILNAISASFASSASVAVSSSYAVSASQAQNAVTASYLSGYVSPFPYTGSAQITGSLGVTGSVNISGSTGALFSANIDTISFTGSFTQSGSLIVSGSINVTSGVTGSLFGTSSWANNATSASYASGSTSASFATQAANATTASYILNAVSASYASSSTSASFASTASLAPLYVLNSVTSSMLAPYVLTSQTSSMTVLSASYASGSTSASYASSSTSASFASTSSFVTIAQTASFVSNAQTASYVLQAVSASYTSASTSASFAATAALAPNYVLNSITSSMLAPYVLTSQTSSMTVLSASYASGSTSASYASQSTNASTASYILQAVSASYASSSTSASFASTASLAPLYVLNSVTSSMLAPYVLTSQTSSMSVLSASYASGSTSASFASTASFIKNAQTASYILQAVSASYASGSTSASYASASTSASYALTASYLLNAISSSFASTASSADDLLVRGTLTAQTIVVQTITASTEFVTGSSKFGSIITNTHQFTGSVSVSGSITVTNGVINNLTASNASNAVTASYALISTSASYASSSTSASYALQATTASYSNNSTSASYALSSSYAANADLLDGNDSSIFATTGSNIFVGNQTITGSLTLSGSGHSIAGIISASNTLYVGVTQPTLALDTRGRILYSNFFSNTSSLPSSSEYHGMFVHVHSEGAAYYSHGSNGWVRLWDRFNDPGLISGSQVPSYIIGQAISPLSVSASSFISASSFYGDGSGITNAISAKTASYVNPLNQTVIITGSLITSGSNTLIGNTQLTGSIGVSGSQTFVGTNTITGSVNISGSTTQIGNNTLLGNTALTGSITISGSLGTTNPSIRIYGDLQQSGYHRFDPVTTSIDTTISASYIYVSGSTNDLYFAQNNNGYVNTTRLRWLEGNLYTGLLNGGIITAVTGSTTYTVGSGSGVVVNLNASYANNPYPTIQYVNWPNLTASIAPLSASYDQQFVAILSNGTIGAQGTPYNDGDFNTKIPIGIVLHQNRSTINAVQTFPGVAYGWKQRSYDFIKAFGPLKISGYSLSPSGSSTGSLVLSGGTAWVDGRNYIVDPSNPSYINEATGITTSKIYRYYQSGSGWVYDTNGGAGYGDIDPTQYSNNGVLTPVATNDWSIQRVFYFPNSATKAFYIYYGNSTYSSEANALAAVSTETFNEAPNTAANAIYVGYMILRHNADFTVPASYAFYQAGLFRNSGAGGGTGGGGGGATTLAALTDVLISSVTSGQALVYDSVAGKWENKSYISASISGTSLSSSYALTASFLSAAVTSASYASSSTSASYAILAQTANTASYVVTAQTASYVLQAVSASYASSSTSASYANNATSASYAQTASYIANINKKVRTQIPIIATQGQTTYITNIPAAVDEVGTELRIRENLLNVSSASLSARVEVATGGVIGFLRMQYSTDESTWNDFGTVATPYVIDLGVTGSQLTTEEPIPSGAKTTATYLRLVTSNADGTAASNARFGNVTLNIIYDL